jgi:hypothetical protein
MFRNAKKMSDFGPQTTQIWTEKLSIYSSISRKCGRRFGYPDKYISDINYRILKNIRRPSLVGIVFEMFRDAIKTRQHSREFSGVSGNSLISTPLIG